MSKIYRNLTEIVITWYAIEVKDNEVFMTLDSLEYRCVSCDKSQYADLSIVPPSRLAVKCATCDKRLATLHEDDFMIPMIPVDEAYDHVPLIGMTRD